MTEISNYPLRLPRSVKAAAEQLARDEGISLNRLVATAVAEKLAVMRPSPSLPNGASGPNQLRCVRFSPGRAACRRVRGTRLGSEVGAGDLIFPD